ncbi:MAG: hypothetical protein CXZ00_16835 [Acidobacteria bacterium]|nr:MAG: hypothetical protein CXZ00_16835 [Acidobacteriota bacterium]
MAAGVKEDHDLNRPPVIPAAILRPLDAAAAIAASTHVGSDVGKLAETNIGWNPVFLYYVGDFLVICITFVAKSPSSM